MSIGEERIRGDIYHFIERELRDYHANKKKIKDWEEECIGILEGGGNRVLGLADDRRPQNKTSDPVSAKAMRLLMQEGDIDRAKHWCKAIEDVLEDLPPEDKQLIELRYFSYYYTNLGAAGELHISERQFNNRRNRIFRQLGVRMGLL